MGLCSSRTKEALADHCKPDVVIIKPPTAMNDLVESIREGNLERVKSICEKEVNRIIINMKHESTTPLIESIKSILLDKEERRYQILRSLVFDYGADVKISDPKNHEPPIYHAIKTNDRNTLEILLKNKDIKVNQRYGASGMTALHYAIIRRARDAVLVLVQQNGLDINVQDKEGNSPLHLAVDIGLEDYVFIILTSQLHKINLDLTNKNGLTVERINTGSDCSRRSREMVIIFKEAKKNPGTSDEEMLKQFQTKLEDKGFSSLPPVTYNKETKYFVCGLNNLTMIGQVIHKNTYNELSSSKSADDDSQNEVANNSGSRVDKSDTKSPFANTDLEFSSANILNFE